MKSYRTELPGTAKELHPQRNTYRFGSIKITSDFDSGNVGDVFQVSERYYTMGIVGDGQPFDDSFPFKKWFYFSIEGIEQGIYMLILKGYSVLLVCCINSIFAIQSIAPNFLMDHS